MQKGQKERNARQSRLSWMKRIAAALIAIIFIGGAATTYKINKDSDEKARLAAANATIEAITKGKAEAKADREAAVAATKADAEKEAAIKLTKAKADQAAALKLADQKAKTDKEKALAEAKAKADKAAALKLADQKAKADKETADKLAKADKAAALTLAKQKAMADKETADKLAKADKAAALKLAEEKAKADKVIALKLAEQKAKTEKETAIKIAKADAKAKADQAKAIAMTKAKADKEAAVATTKAIADAKLIKEQKKAFAILTIEKKKAEYEAYVAKIGLTKARIDQNEFEGAELFLQELKKKSAKSKGIDWELKYLLNKAAQSRSTKTSTENDATPPAGLDITSAPSGKFMVAALEGGSVLVASINSKGLLQKHLRFSVGKDVDVTAVAISPDEKIIATASTDGIIRLWNVNNQSKSGELTGHTASIPTIKFLKNGQLLSGSYDKTVRLWSIATKTEIARCKHIGPVSDLAAVLVGSEVVLATSVSDKETGRAVVWRRAISSNKPYFKRAGIFLGHNQPVFTIAINSTGTLVASGDRAGIIFTWDPSKVQTVDYASAISSALKTVENPTEHVNATTQNHSIEITHELVDPNAATQTKLLLTGNKVKAHQDAIESLTFSADGKSLLSGSDDHTIKVWNVLTGSIHKTLRGHGGWVRSVKFSATNPDLVLSTANDGTIRTWSVASYVDTTTYQVRNQPVRELKPHDSDILSASFGPLGKRILTSSRDRTARILTINPQTLSFGKSVPLVDFNDDSLNNKTLMQEGSQYVSQSMAVDMTRKRVFVGGFDSQIRIWGLNDGNELASVSGTGINTSFALSQDGSLLLTGSSDKDVKAKVWKIDYDTDGNLAPILLWKLAEGHSENVTAFAISADASLLLTGDRSGTCIIWNAKTGQPIGIPFSPNDKSRLNAAQFLPNAKEILIASDNGTVTRVNLKSREVTQKLKHTGFVTGLSISQDGKQAATVSYSSSKEGVKSQLTLWDLPSNTKTILENLFRSSKESNEKSTKNQSRILSARFGTVPGTMVSTYRGGKDSANYIQLWKIDSAGKPHLLRKIEFKNQLPFADVALQVQENKLLTLNGNAAFLWDTDSLGHVKSYRSHATVTQASFFQNGKFVITASRSVKIWNATTGKSILKKENPHQGSVLSVQCSPEKSSNLFATGGDDGMVRLWKWDSQANKITSVRNFDCSTNNNKKCSVYRVVFSHNGDQILSVGDDGVARVWNTHENRPAIVFNDKNAATAFRCGAFSPDDKWILVGCDDKKARVWKVDSPVESRQSPDVILQGHADRIDDVKFLPNASASSRIATASRDKSVRIWDPKLENFSNENKEPINAREIIALRKHSLGVTAVDTTKSGDLLMTAGLDGKVILWPAKLPK